MPITVSFLATCRTSIIALPEYTTFNTSYAALVSASRASRPTYWQATYGDGSPTSPAYLFHLAIRNTVTALASTTGGISPLETEEAIRTLAAEYIPRAKRPKNYAEESAALQELLLQDQMS